MLPDERLSISNSALPSAVFQFDRFVHTDDVLTDIVKRVSGRFIGGFCGSAAACHKGSGQCQC